MTTQTVLRGENLQIVGYIEVNEKGAQVLLDAHYRRIGYFDPTTNATSDEHFRRVGTGNILTSLLPVRR